MYAIEMMFGKIISTSRRQYFIISEWLMAEAAVRLISLD